MATKKITYEQYKEATYHFRIYNYDTGQLIPCWCSCRVWGETVMQYRIQLCAAIPKHAIGDYIWVHKQFVKFKS